MLQIYTKNVTIHAVHGIFLLSLLPMKHLFMAILAYLALAQSVCAYGQKFRVATWNVENLFDTIHDEGKEDLEFLPLAQRKWNGQRYWRKLRNISQTLAAMELPHLVALQEVENDTVLRDLTRRTQLWPAGYKYIITDSPDTRGIDVALLYRPEAFCLLSWQSVRVPCQEYGLSPTRDILLAKGRVGQDTLNVCVVHLPSRRNNNLQARQKRYLALQKLCHLVDSLGDGKTLIMGDFNAEPGDTALAAFSSRVCTLLPTDRKTLRSRRGTYYFRGIWGFLDHIFVSSSLREQALEQARECRFPWLLRTAKEIPHRTYGGVNYIGGISDHLPLTAVLDMAVGKEGNESVTE